MRKIGFLALVLLIGMWACEYETIVPVKVDPQEDPVSFSTQVAPIFVEVNCVSCHAGGISPDLRADKSYAALVGGGKVDTANPAGSKLMEKINSGHGTAGNMTAAQKALILQWITEGAQDN